MDEIQPEKWTLPRNITIKFPSITKAEPELITTFRVEPDHRIEFGKIINDYMNFCCNARSMIRLKDDITDAETGETCAITIEINGNRQAVAPEMQRIGNSLLQHSTRLR